MSPAGYYRTSEKDARARAARIAKRGQAAKTVEGKRATAKRLAAKKASARAHMTSEERRLADRREIEAFTAKRVAANGVAAARKTTQPPKIKTPAEKRSEKARKRQKKWSLFPSLTGALMGKKK